MIETFFSTEGRLQRLNYFLLSFSTGILILVIYFGFLAYMANHMEPSEYVQMLTGGILGVGAESPIMGLLLLLSAWFQICFSFKRSRDFSGGTRFAWIYNSLLFAPTIVLGLIGNSGMGTVMMMVVQLVVAIPTFVMVLILLFKPSNGAVVTDDDTKAFGDAPKVDYDTAGLGNLTDETDLVARAAQLREAEAAKQALKPSSEPTSRGRPAPGGFGRRGGAPAFGNR